ncbi:hypothetical protein [Flaviaesturariibacter amylovorans]|uniref:hypothetical protein n=1 Tax=Flaviaesturariibacter amylovorans TaxID=1084520 RepID=UPI0031E9B5B2
MPNSKGKSQKSKNSKGDACFFLAQHASRRNYKKGEAPAVVCAGCPVPSTSNGKEDQSKTTHFDFLHSRHSKEKGLSHPGKALLTFEF